MTNILSYENISGLGKSAAWNIGHYYRDSIHAVPAFVRGLSEWLQPWTIISPLGINTSRISVFPHFLYFQLPRCHTQDPFSSYSLLSLTPISISDCSSIFFFAPPLLFTGNLPSFFVVMASHFRKRFPKVQPFISRGFAHRCALYSVHQYRV